MKPKLETVDSESFGALPPPPPPPKMAFGALPPPEMEWQEGRTAASIVFVNQAERTVLLLQSKIEEVKSKKLELTDWLEVRVFLQQQGIN